MLITGIKLLLFVISMGGYILFVERKLKIQVEFIPIISISVITTILFFGGLLNILPLTTLVLFFTGIALMSKEVYSNYYDDSIGYTLSKFVTPGILLFIVASLYFTFMLKDQRLLHYDNFSHWAVIVKNMLLDNALPNFEDTIVGFNTYPPGSALYIYYFSKIVGISEGIALIAQISIVLSALLTLFSFSSFSLLDFKEDRQLYGKETILTIITLIVTLYLLDGPSTIHNLLVDTVLNIVGLSLFAMIYYYLDSVEKIFIPIVFMVSFLTLIKNSGMFFGIFGLVLYAYGLKKYRKNTKFNLIKSKPVLLTPFVSPVLTYYLWGQHVSMVFPTGKIGKHTMSIDSYLNTFREKTPGEIQEISNNYLNTLSNEYAYQLLMILLLIVGLIVLQKLLNNYLDRRLILMSIVIFSMFLVYSLGLWIMYLVSMPTAESLFLAGYGRYMSTIMDYILGIAAISLLYTLNKSNSTNFIIGGSIITTVFFSYLTFANNTENIISIFQKREFSINQDYLSIPNIDISLTNLSTNPLKSITGSKSYSVYYPKAENESIDYEQFFLKYRLYQDSVDIIRSLDYIEDLWNYDYLSITLVTDEVNDFFEKYSDEIPKIGTYQIDSTNEKIFN